MIKEFDDSSSFVPGFFYVTSPGQRAVEFDAYSSSVFANFIFAPSLFFFLVKSMALVLVVLMLNLQTFVHLTNSWK